MLKALLDKDLIVAPSKIPKKMMSSHQGLSFPQEGDRVSLGPFGLLRSHIFAVSPRLFSI